MAEIPKEFGVALAKAGLAAFFAGCTGPHQNEYLKWIAGARRPETREARISRAVEMLAAKAAGEKARARNRSSRKTNR